jgi:hypothetical protein
VRVGPGDGVAINPFGGDLFAASAFDGVIEIQDHYLLRDQHRDQQPEQQATGLERGSDGPVEDAMIGLKVGVGTEPHYL